MRKFSPITVTASVLGTLSVIYYFICGCLRTFTYSGLWIWLAFGIIMWFGCLWKIIAEPMLIKTEKKVLYLRLKTVCLLLVLLFMLVFAVFECLIVHKWIVGCTDSESEPDAIIVLGAAVEYDRPGDALGYRIGTAYGCISKNPEIPVIVCGGLSDEDVISEADCIKRELIKMGISESVIITESESSSTYENFLFASSVLPDDADSVAVVTSGFHELRACITGESVLRRVLGHTVELHPVSAPYPSILLPFSMVREFAAFVSDLFDGNISLG